MPMNHGGVVSEDTLFHKVSIDVTWCYDDVPISIGEIEHNALNDELIRVVRNKALRTGAGLPVKSGLTAFATVKKDTSLLVFIPPGVSP